MIIRTIYRDDTTYIERVETNWRYTYLLCSNNLKNVKDLFSTDTLPTDEITTYKLINSFVISDGIKNMYRLNEKRKEKIKDVMGYCLLHWYYRFQDQFEYTPINIPLSPMDEQAYVDIPKLNGEKLRVIVQRHSNNWNNSYFLAVGMDNDFTDEDIREFLKFYKKHNI